MAIAAGSVVIAAQLGLYRALAAAPLRPNELAERTGTAGFGRFRRNAETPFNIVCEARR